MKIAAMATMLVLTGTVVQAKGPVPLDDPMQVTVCMQSLADFATTARAQGIAAQMFAGIGVRVAWHEMSGCPPQSILVSLSERAPASFHPGALAYALPYEGSRVVLFPDRIAGNGHTLMPHLMAHVMVHEIAHILQGVVRHSGDGVMKAHWGQQDFNRMMESSLDFTAEDAELIHDGLLARAARRGVRV